MCLRTCLDLATDDFDWPLDYGDYGFISKFYEIMVAFPSFMK